MMQINLEVLEKQANKFNQYIHFNDKNDSPLNFIDGKSILVKEEGYKALVPNRSRTVLNVEEWDESWIGSGKIQSRICKIMDLGYNLTNFNSRIDFRKHFESDKKEYNPDSERVIYEIYKGSDDKSAFEHAIEVFGAKYPIIAYLFFVKDENKYLPTSPSRFDLAFKELGIDFEMSFKCSWDNYTQYIEIIKNIGNLMPQYLDISHNVRLLDAHSFVWIIGEEKYMDWNENPSDINVPMKPKDIIKDEHGLTKYQCPRCDSFFKQAKRCPECGQAIEV